MEAAGVLSVAFGLYEHFISFLSSPILTTTVDFFSMLLSQLSSPPSMAISRHYSFTAEGWSFFPFSYASQYFR